MELSLQKYWNGLPFPPPGILLTQGSNPGVLKWQANSLPLSHRKSPKPQIWSYLPKLERCPPMLRVLYAFSSPVKDGTKESNSNQGVQGLPSGGKALFVSILTFPSNSLFLSLAIMLPCMYCAPSPSPHGIFHSLILLPERLFFQSSFPFISYSSLVGEGHGNPLQYSCLENPVDRGAWWAAVHRIAQSRTWVKWLSMHACVGEGNGNPLQYSCLENPRERGAWWAAVYGSNRVGHDWSDLAAAAAALVKRLLLQERPS